MNAARRVKQRPPNADVTGLRSARFRLLALVLAASVAKSEANPIVQRTVAPFGQFDIPEAAGLSPDEILSCLRSGSDGLSSEDAAARLRQFGPNTLGTHEVHAGAVLWRQLRNPILVLLLVAALVSGLTGGGTNAVIIAVIVVLSVGLGFFNEYRAESAMASLRSKIRHDADALRDGRMTRVPVTDLVPGDLVSLHIGALVPADLRLLKVDELECDEGTLTGESMPVPKAVAAVSDHQALDQPGCAFMGTIVHQGSGLGVVVQTGARTAFGKIAAGLSERQSQTAFETGLARFSRFLFGVAAALTLFIFIMNVVLARPLITALLFSLAIAIGIAPEMMPAIVTVSLSAGSKALAAKKVLVKRLVAVEDLGNIEILFTDKTGTLTEGVITFSRSLDSDGQASDRPLLLGLLCNEATPTEQGPVGGNALDQALWLAPGAATGGEVASVADRHERLGVLPFDHDRQLVSVLVKDPAGKPLMITKGAPEVVLERCVNVPDSARPALEALFNEGARVVAVATRSAEGKDTVGAQDEQGLTFAGFLTFADRPKPDAGSSIAQLQRLGVDVKIITGDNGLVAAKVCSDIGFQCAAVLSGSEVESLDDDELEAAIPATTVFARISPDQKSRIIKVARRSGKDVAFLGDGVNDAVALHHADVGISVDSGTDVAKDAADVVLLDKDLGVLADGVMEGRRIFANTMKYVLMATSSNFGNMFSAAGASVILTFLPMLPTQILLNNLLYNAGQMVIPTDLVDPEALAPAGGLGHQVHSALHGHIRTSQFDLRLHHFLGHARRPRCRSCRVQDGLVRRVDRHSDLGHLCDQNPQDPVPEEPPSKWMLLVPTGMALVGAILPWTGLAHLLGFTPLPAKFFLILFGMVVLYLLLCELAKSFFYRLPHARTPRAPLYSCRALGAEHAQAGVALRPL